MERFRTKLTPPVREHLSFRLGNQIFFVWVEVEKEQFGSYDLFNHACEQANAIPCILPIVKSPDGYAPYQEIIQSYVLNIYCDIQSSNNAVLQQSLVFVRENEIKYLSNTTHLQF